MPQPATSLSTLTLCPRILLNSLLARFALPLSANHFGLSTAKNRPASCPNPMIPPTPKITLHSCPRLMKYPSTCAKSIPNPMLTCVNAPKKPFSAGGATSLM